ncbi:response regulator [Sphingomonas parva]|uniref:Response regulator n=1 Tax=Sphingomonas parva TaxID=2555898 RepID=A0A4Y8ZRP8_9SPHN|nr:response regulator [Sphingomonas parva]TFI57086.1 response regulator [Sphingomonas parva]
MRTGSVYLVEDDDAVRASLRTLLRLADWTVTDFASGTAFVDALATLEPGCVILDMRMPDMDGLAVIQKMAEQGIDWPVVVMTGHPDPGIAAAVLKRGAIEFLEKPCREEDMFAALERGLDALDGRARG